MLIYLDSRFPPIPDININTFWTENEHSIFDHVTPAYFNHVLQENPLPGGWWLISNKNDPKWPSNNFTDLDLIPHVLNWLSWTELVKN